MNSLTENPLTLGICVGTITTGPPAENPPERGGRSPAIVFISVLFPLPFGPQSITDCPSEYSKVSGPQTLMPLWPIVNSFAFSIFTSFLSEWPE